MSSNPYPHTAKNWEKAQIPKRFQGMVLEDYDTSTGDAEAVKVVDEWLTNVAHHHAEGRGLCFTGPPGEGKTMLACIAAQQFMEREKAWARFYTYPTYMQMLSRQMSLETLAQTGDGDAADAWMKLDKDLRYIRKTLPLLVLDDVGKEYAGGSAGKSWAEFNFDWFLRYRFDKALPTIITSNVPLSDWAVRYGPAMESFIREACLVVPVVTGRDARRR